jgi:hypothetical protein
VLPHTGVTCGSVGRPSLLQAQLQKDAWGAALQRAKGDKVLDDPRLLQKSLKKVC